MNREIMKKVLYPNCLVEFTYEHHLNSKSSITITKEGQVVRHVRSRKGFQRPTGYVMVKLNGNKGLSKIHESRLTPIATKIKTNQESIMYKAQCHI